MAAIVDRVAAVHVNGVLWRRFFFNLWKLEELLSILEPLVIDCVNDGCEKPMATQNSFQELFFSKLGELYHVEFQLAVALPKLSGRLRGAELSPLVRRSLHETDVQLTRLEEIFDMLDQPAACEPCWSPGKFMIDAYEAAQSKDAFNRVAGTALALLHVKHLELVSYQALLAWSYRCGMDKPASLLQRSLTEELAMAQELSEHAFAASKSGLFEPAPAEATIN
jgi:ferritin-like metal-binding protein YciE